MIIFKQSTLRKLVHAEASSQVTGLKADIKELKKQVGYWMIDSPDMANMFAVFTSHKPAKPEFSVAEKVQAILDHLGMEIEKTVCEEEIVCKPKKPVKKPVVYRKRGLKVGKK